MMNTMNGIGTMHKKTAMVVTALLVMAFAGLPLFLAGCADPQGLHNQKQTLVTFELVNFPLGDGDYCVSGDWQGTNWDNSKANITLKDRAGVSAVQSVKSSDVKFSVVPVGSWGRPWYPLTQGNTPDESQNNTPWNFLVQGIPMDAEITIVVDGGAKPATLSVK
ncbi:MAG: hypothetical protein LBT00_01060 [Spirochaetaceae bacterium]|jgi:hypothetical protein|nr:hypothetical protein [Spirochaetaceae bacterium]